MVGLGGGVGGGGDLPALGDGHGEAKHGGGRGVLCLWSMAGE